MKLSVQLEDWLEVRHVQGVSPMSRDRYFVRIADNGFLVSVMDNGRPKVDPLSKAATRRYRDSFNQL